MSHLKRQSDALIYSVILFVHLFLFRGHGDFFILSYAGSKINMIETLGTFRLFNVFNSSFDNIFTDQVQSAYNQKFLLLMKLHYINLLIP